MLSVVGAWLGGSVSMDLSNHPLFVHAHYAFIAFWGVLGLVVGWAVGTKVSDKLSELDLFG